MAGSGAPSIVEIAEKSGLELEDIADLMSVYETQTNLISLDMPAREQGTNAEVSDFVPDDSQDVEPEALNRIRFGELIRLIKEVLPEKDAEIMLRRYGFVGLAATQVQLGKEFGLRTEMVRKIEKTAKKKIALEPLGSDFEEAGLRK